MRKIVDRDSLVHIIIYVLLVWERAIEKYLCSFLVHMYVDYITLPNKYFVLKSLFGI